MTIRAPATLSEHQLAQLRLLETKINAILPPRYQGCFEDVAPKSMGSAKLKIAADGQVAWDEIWTSFCHLALAGGPPHRGTLLEPASTEEVAADPQQQQKVIAEIERAVRLTTCLSPIPCSAPGWVAVRCDDADLAAWLVRAIVAENVIARHEEEVLFVPAGPRFRIEKEIKNVVTSLAKTCHYLVDHLPTECRPAGLNRRLVEPPSLEAVAAAPESSATAARELARGLRQVTRLDTILSQSRGWVGVQCASEEMAVWMLRAVAVEDVLVRREADALFVPAPLDTDRRRGIDRVLAVVAQAHRLWRVHVARAGLR